MTASTGGSIIDIHTGIEEHEGSWVTSTPASEPLGKRSRHEYLGLSGEG